MDLTNLPLWAEVVLIFGLIFALIGSGIWIAFALAGVGLFVLIFMAGGMQPVVGSLLFTALNSFVLMAVPLFIFMGELLLKSGLSSKLYRGTSQWTSALPGGLLHSNIVACSLFAAVSGSSIATAATIGTVALHEQDERGYDRRLIMGSIASGGTLGILIPPSITMIIYGAFVGVSVSKLFIGGIVPGIITAIAFMIFIGIAVLLRPEKAPEQGKINLGYFVRAFKALKDVWPVLLLILVIMGGIYGGVMTPTEAAAIACFVVIVLAIIHRRFNWTILKEAAMSSLRTSAMVLLLMVGARILTTGMSMIKLPAHISDLIISFELNVMLIWFFVVIMYLVLGCFMDGISMMLLTLPVTYPLLVEGLGFDPIWFGVLLTILIECALITPPVGLNLYVIHGISGAKDPKDVIIGIIPFFFILLIGIATFTIFPWLVTWLPGTMIG